MRRFRVGLLAAVLPPLLILPAIGSGDDTEVFFARAAGEIRPPNVLFMFDISGSMDEYDGTPYQRMTRLKQAMIEILENTDGVNVGIGSFGGYVKGGAILQPAVDPDEDVCEDFDCDEVSIRVPVGSPNDDVSEASDGDVHVHGTELNIGSSNDEKIGLRFVDVDIPRGAVIRHAALEFIPYESSWGESTLNVRAEASGHAPAFVDATGNVGNRTLTAASAVWESEDWSEPHQERTSDLAPIVQELVDRGDWCGGNAMAFVIERAGAWSDPLQTRSRDLGQWNAPVLQVSYDPSDVEPGDSCRAHRVTASVQSADDDAEELVSDGTVDTGTILLEPTRDGAAREIGLRFTDVDVPRGASIASAYLELSSAGSVGAGADIEIRVQPTADAPAFDASSAADVTSRTAGASAVRWKAPEALAGERVTSDDLGALVRNVTDGGDWDAGDALVLTLRQSAGTGERRYLSFDGDASSAPRLRVSYRLEGSAHDLTATPLRTVRDDLIDEVLAFRPYGGTPLVDAYHESALYLLGEEVDHGRRRGTQTWDDRYFRISAPATYTGGSLYTPPGCSTVDPNAVACTNEEITGDARYVAPDIGSCQANQIVLLSDGQATHGQSQASVRALTGASACAGRSNSFEDCGVELAEWLEAGDDDADRPSVVTHTVGFNFTSDFLRDLASAGGGNFHEADSASELAGVFRNIVREAADVDTTFVAPGATVSQFNRLQNRDDVYFAMFRPSLRTRWDGNLKRYALSGDPGSGETVFVDALGLPILDEASGGVRDGAKSYWTDGAADGPSVAAGGAANELSLPRKILTYVGEPSGPTALVDLDESNASIDAAALGIDAADTDHRAALLEWARGVDVLDADGDGDVTEIRRQMGDPMHSTPFILNYASDDPEGKSLVFVGTNEGYLHAIDTSDGSEVFGFVPGELLPNLDRFYRDEVRVDRLYGLDGPVGGTFADTNGNGVVDPGEQALVWFGMRRGGRNYYALDVSDPDAPSLAWVIRGGTGNFAELGQSWSRPVLTRMPDGGALHDVLVFGGGYDQVNDTRDERVTGRNGAEDRPDQTGRAIYFVDVWSGAYRARIDSAEMSDMTFSIPSDVNVVDIDVDGVADMLWVGDMGGQLWRFDIDRTATGALATAITGAVVGDLGADGIEDNRRFFYPPDISLIKDEAGGIFMNVGIGSGWRSHPLDEEVEDRFYVLRVADFRGPPRDADGEVAYSRLDEDDLYDATDGSTQEDDSGKSASGWYLTFAEEGEKVLGSALTIDSRILFTSYIPDTGDADECTASAGGGQIYALDALDGGPSLDLNDSGGELTLGDRFVRLKTPGIAPEVSAFVVGDGGVGKGTEVLSAVGTTIVPSDRPPLFERTYWSEQ